MTSRIIGWVVPLFLLGLFILSFFLPPSPYFKDPPVAIALLLYFTVFSNDPFLRGESFKEAFISLIQKSSGVAENLTDSLWDGVKFLFRLALLVSIPFGLRLNGEIHRYIDMLAEQLQPLPEVVVTNGQISSPVLQPYLKQFEAGYAASNKALLMVDTTGATREIPDSYDGDQIKTGLLLTKETAVLRAGMFYRKEFTHLSSFSGLVIKDQTLPQLTQRIKQLVTQYVVIGLPLYLFQEGLVAVLLIGYLLVFTFGGKDERKFSFREAFLIGVYSLPATVFVWTIIHTVYGPLFMWTFPENYFMWKMVFAIMYAGFISITTNSLLRQEKKESLGEMEGIR